MNWFFLAAALALLLWFFALFYLKSLVQRRTGADHILSLLQEEVRLLEADIDEKTEQNLQLLEEKINALREICSEAERRIAIYGRELEKREKETQALAALDRGMAAVHGAAAHDKVAVPSTAGAQEPAAHGQLPPEKKRTGQRAPHVRKPARENTPPKPGTSVPLLATLELWDPAHPAGAAHPGDAALDAADSAYRAQTGQPSASMPRIIVSGEPLLAKQPPVKDRIAELYRAGFAPKLIAKRLGLTLGEVTLYVNMCKSQGNTQGNANA